MNLLLLEEAQFGTDGLVSLTPRQAEHVLKVLRAQPGDTLRVGRRGGPIGTGIVRALPAHPRESLRLEVTLSDAPPQRPGIELILAMPRPKALKRLFPAAASLGVDRIILINAARVERSFFGSPALTPETIDRLLCEGVEQARDTVLPEILIRPRFRPFVEDELETLLPASGPRLLPHPTAPETLPAAPAISSQSKVTFAVGPEGGWLPFEVELLRTHGFQPFSLGPRILRVETVIPYLLGLRMGMLQAR